MLAFLSHRSLVSSLLQNKTLHKCSVSLKLLVQRERERERGCYPQYSFCGFIGAAGCCSKVVVEEEEVVDSFNILELSPSSTALLFMLSLALGFFELAFIFIRLLCSSCYNI